MYKNKKLQEIAKEIGNCSECKKGKIGVAVPGEGNSNAKIVFMGEAPGKNEAREGRPFIGKSGKYLRQVIREVGLNESDVFITSPVKYLPERGTPTKEDIEHGMIHTAKQLEVINPKIIVLMGNVAVQGVLGEKMEILKRHGDIIEKEGRKYLVTFHPAYAIRFDRGKGLFKKDFAKIKDLYGTN
jgi:uracil-DNA glycosylase